MRRNLSERNLKAGVFTQRHEYHPQPTTPKACREKHPRIPGVFSVRPAYQSSQTRS